MGRAFNFGRRAALALAVIGLGACGDTVHRAATPKPVTTAAPPPPILGAPAPGPTNVAAPAAAVAVIRGWSQALERGDVAAAARYFAIPSVLVNDADASGQALVIHIFSFKDALAANASLSCGAQLLATDLRGSYVNALFRLTDRPGAGAGCGSGSGQTARTNFVISDGHIVQWLRAPPDPGDGGGGSGSSSGPAAAA